MSAKLGSIDGLKENNPVITSGCRTVIEFVSIFWEEYLYKEVVK